MSDLGSSFSRRDLLAWEEPLECWPAGPYPACPSWTRGSARGGNRVIDRKVTQLFFAGEPPTD